MNPKNDGEKRNGGALEGGAEGESEMIDLFDLASENDTVYSQTVEDIFYFGNDSDEEDEEYDDSDEEDEEYDDSDEEDEEYDDSDEEDEEYDDSDEEDEEYDDSDEEDEEYDDSDEEDEEYDDSDEEDEEYDDSDEEDEDYDDSDEEDEEYDDSDEEDEEYIDSDEEDEEYDDSDQEDEEYDDSDEEDEEDEDYDDSDEEDGDYDDSDEEDEDYDDSDEEDEDYDDSDEEDEDYDDSDEEDEDYDDSDDEDEIVPASGFVKKEWFDDDGFKALSDDDFDISSFVKDKDVDNTVDLYEVANKEDDLPVTETHGALYYWAKRKTAAGWVKFALKCFALFLLIVVASGVLYFNGLLNLIDYKAAGDFKQYYNLSETDYQDDVDDVYSSPVYYNESTTIEGFNESMIDIQKKDVLNVLLIGTDVRGGTYEDRGNTDSMILVSINTRDKNIKLTSFMRDMYVDIPERQWARLNAAYAYGGPQLLFDTLKKNFDVDVDLYVRVNFANFRKIVNHVGGVDIELSEAEARYMNKNSQKYNTDPVEPGWQHLDGAQALSYARCRKIDSDFNRTKRQRTVILALVKEIKGSSPGELNSLLNVFLPMIQTNMSKMQILSLMTDGTRYLNNNIETLNIPIKNSWRSQIINKRDVICPNFELNKTAIVAHIYSTYRLDVEGTKNTTAATSVDPSSPNSNGTAKTAGRTSRSAPKKTTSQKNTSQPVRQTSFADSQPTEPAQIPADTAKEALPTSVQATETPETAKGE